MPEVTAEQVLGAYATGLDAYYEAETRFRRSPSLATLAAYHLALDRLRVLRDEVVRNNRFADAVLGPAHEFDGT